MVSHIDPTQIPGDNLDPDTVDSSANQMRLIGTNVTNQGSTVLTSWQAISASYEAPESGTLFSVMNPVSSNAELFGSNLGKVADALNAYAEAVRPIKAELASLKAQASAFVNSVKNGVSHTSYSRAGATTSTESWDKDQDSVDKNNDLINKVNAQMVLLWAAERDCANKIYDTIGWSHIEAASQSNPNGYGVDKIPDGTKMPWGSDVKRTESCGEKAADAVGHFVWNGVIVGGLWGTVKGLGTLILGYNPADGSFFKGSTYGAAWSNLGMLGVGLASVGPLGAGLSMMPGPVGDFVRKGQSTMIEAGKGMIAWDEWSKDPATAAGTAVFNVGTILLPGGAEVDGVKTGASVAGTALNAAGKVAEFADPVSVLMKVGATGLKAAMPTIADLTKSLSGALHLSDLGDLSKVDLPRIEIPTAGDHSFDFAHGGDVPGASSIDVPKADIPPVHATVDAPGAAVIVHAGEHEPVLVGAGGESHTVSAGADSSGSVVHTGGGDTSAATHSGGDGVATGHGGGNDTPTGPTDHGSAPTAPGDDRPWTPEDGDPTLSGASHGPGWTRIEGVRGDPIDPDYGLPRADHGHLADAYAPPPVQDIPEPVRSLDTDPGAPYGRDLDGQPYTRSEWEDRYTQSDDTPRYPGNDGAVPGTRIEFTDVTEFQANYGDLLDRMGGNSGSFLSFPDTPFELRGLPGSNLSAPYSTLELTGHLPEHVHIEVSEVAPAFGQPGGGLQVRFMDDTTGRPLSVQQLEGSDYNVIHHVDDATATSMPHYTDGVLGVDHAASVDHGSGISHSVIHDAGHDAPAHASAVHDGGAHDATAHDGTSGETAHHSTDASGGDGGTPSGHAIAAGDGDPIVWRDEEHGVALTASEHSLSQSHLTEAQSIEPHTTAAMQSISHSIPGSHLVGLDYRLKDPDSFFRKIATRLQDRADAGLPTDLPGDLDKMKDTVRYTMTFNESDYSTSTNAAMNKLVDEGFTPVDMSKSWGDTGYRGVNTWWSDSSGHVFEVQFHTPASWEAKGITHPIYEELRAPSTPVEKLDELAARQEEIFGSVPRPAGTEAIVLPDRSAK